MGELFTSVKTVNLTTFVKLFLVEKKAAR